MHACASSLVTFSTTTTKKNSIKKKEEQEISLADIKQSSHRHNLYVCNTALICVLLCLHRRQEKRRQRGIEVLIFQGSLFFSRFFSPVLSLFYFPFCLCFSTVFFLCLHTARRIQAQGGHELSGESPICYYFNFVCKANSLLLLPAILSYTHTHTHV